MTALSILVRAVPVIRVAVHATVNALRDDGTIDEPEAVTIVQKTVAATGADVPEAVTEYAVLLAVELVRWARQEPRRVIQLGTPRVIPPETLPTPGVHP